MSVVIRLTKIGKKGERKFRVVVKEKRSRREGAAIETLGWYEKGKPGQDKKNINKDRYEYWTSKGAKPSQVVAAIMKV